MTRATLRCAVAGAVLCFALAAEAEDLAIRFSRVPLDPEYGAVRRVGELIFRGGLDLRSDDPRFGGLSALTVDAAGGRLLAVTDTGDWVSARLRYTRSGDLIGIDGARIGRLRGPGGRRYKLKRQRDAESVALTKDGLVVAFEHWHRLWLYPAPGRDPGWSARPRAIVSPPGLRRAPSNSGLEALTALATGEFLAITEGLKAGDGAVRGWIGGIRKWRPIRYIPAARFRPTGATTLPGGDVLVLERRATWLGGLAARIVRLKPAALSGDKPLVGDEIARLELPLSVDNFEGIASRPGPDGAAMVYLVSDDNFSALQRTLLLMFELPR